MPSVDDVILMNIAAGNRTPNDRLDLRALWPSSSFTTPQAAVEAFNKAYPLEDPGPYLVDWIATVVDGTLVVGHWRVGHGSATYGGAIARSRRRAW